MGPFERDYEVGCWGEHFISKSSYLPAHIESPEFDENLRSAKHVEAQQKGFSRLSTEVQYGKWCLPCHVIFARTRLGMLQTFHVQPDKLGPTHLTHSQLSALRDLGREDGKTVYIAVQSERGRFGHCDQRDLEKMDFDTHRVIEIPSRGRWRAMYDPRIDQIWIDDSSTHTLRKYRGFATASEGWDGIRRHEHIAREAESAGKRKQSKVNKDAA